ncbi:MAG: ATP-binding cassette domain-containing protein [Candidatus Competibacteraceae bacterium]|nr:ATP-binding cassette domain-containing protein [Candidatus Competibacteraceae bacterium]
MLKPLACTATGIRLSYALTPGDQSTCYTVLDIARFTATAGASIGITGPSGAGKTSLIHVLTGIESADTATIRWGDINITELGESARDAWRRDHVGLVFQDFYLFPGLSVLQNVTLPATFGGADNRLKTRAYELLDRVGINPNRHTIDTLSRGECQRVAIARALLKTPPLIVADEPTASLDAASSCTVIDLLLEARDQATLLTVSHDPALLERMDTVHILHNGCLSTTSTTTA